MNVRAALIGLLAALGVGLLWSLNTLLNRIGSGADPGNWIGARGECVLFLVTGWTAIFAVLLLLFEWTQSRALRGLVLSAGCVWLLAGMFEALATVLTGPINIAV